MAKASGGNRRNVFLSKLNALQVYNINKGRPNEVKNPIPYAGKEMLQRTFLSQDRWYDNKIGSRIIDISKLETIQPIVNKSTILRKVRDKEMTNDIPVVHIDGRYILQDGNHTVATALLKGNKKIKVTIYQYK